MRPDSPDVPTEPWPRRGNNYDRSSWHREPKAVLCQTKANRDIDAPCGCSRHARAQLRPPSPAEKDFPRARGATTIWQSDDACIVRIVQLEREPQYLNQNPKLRCVQHNVKRNSSARACD